MRKKHLNYNKSISRNRYMLKWKKRTLGYGISGRIHIKADTIIRWYSKLMVSVSSNNAAVYIKPVLIKLKGDL